jgi:hypothetical protein
MDIAEKLESLGRIRRLVRPGIDQGSYIAYLHLSADTLNRYLFKKTINIYEARLFILNNILLFTDKNE